MTVADYEDYREQDYEPHRGRGSRARDRGERIGTRGHRGDGRYSREERIRDEPAPTEAIELAWVGSHPQSYPKRENVWKIENVNYQIKEKGENVSKN